MAAIEAGNLIENATFDAKAALPEKGKSKDLAKDVAAMANNGGTLPYGVGEDEHSRPTVPKPFKISGARERVDQIVRASISEPPSIEVYAISAYDGFLVVVVQKQHLVTFSFTPGVVRPHDGWEDTFGAAAVQVVVRVHGPSHGDEPLPPDDLLKRR
ncbi:MAG: putative DNA binding domain-containing protein [Rubrobacter sp.]|nr:putative DNA binding domain-containing protein [Rubrobacter sp.]